LVGHGNSVDSRNNFSEFQIFGGPQPGNFQITIYPNPARQVINILIEYPNSVPEGGVAITSLVVRIFNTSGMLVFEKLLDPGIINAQIPINLKTGIYIVQMLSGKATVAANKLVVIN
jgi:hypothetical protein